MNHRLAVILSVISYSLTSASMLLLNKLVLHQLPYPSLVSAIQIAAALAMIYGAKMVGLVEVDKIEWKNVVPYFLYVILFCLSLLCNMHSLEYANVETVIVFRALTPCGVAILDYVFLGRELPGLRSWTALALIVAGAYRYACVDEEFQTQGWTAYIWPIAYFFTISIGMCAGKSVISSVDLKTQSGPVAYTNLLSFLPMLAFAAVGNEFGQLHEDLASGLNITPSAIVMLVLSSVAGTAIGYTSWWCRDMISATSFTLVGVMNKFLTILMNLLVWDEHASPAGIAALVVILIGGSLYEQAPIRNASKEAEGYTSAMTDEEDLGKESLGDNNDETETTVDEEEEEQALSPVDEAAYTKLEEKAENMEEGIEMESLLSSSSSSSLTRTRTRSSIVQLYQSERWSSFVN